MSSEYSYDYDNNVMFSYKYIIKSARLNTRGHKIKLFIYQINNYFQNNISDCDNRCI